MGTRMLVSGFLATSLASFPLLTALLLNTTQHQQDSPISTHHDAEDSFEGNPTLWLGTAQSRSYPADLKWSVSFARQVIAKMTRFERALVSSDVLVRQGTPAQGQLIESRPCPEAMEQGTDALVAVKATVFLTHNHCTRYGHTEATACAELVAAMKVNTTSLGDKCLAPLGRVPGRCADLRYRTANGSCNHEHQGVAVGQAVTGYRRLVAARYGDGLPSARLLSTRLTSHRDTPHPHPRTHTLAVMQWSQFVAHDMAHTPLSAMANTGRPIMCCKADGSQLKPRHRHPACMPIIIPDNDPFYAQFHVKCMNYVRSMPALRNDCSFGPREQMNQVSHYLDGSMIYGSNDEKALDLRLLSGGLLREDSTGKKGFLPLVSNPMKHCQVNSVNASCYLSGDGRVNGHPLLTAMHVLWLREHNRLAGELALINPSWSDETLYQEARRILIAQIQHITYTQWLPVLIGSRFMESLGINISSGQIGKYYEEVDPSVSNSFATAAMRYIYSMMPSKLHLYDEQRRHQNRTLLNLKDNFNKPLTVKESGHLDALIRCLATEPSLNIDLDYIQDVTDLLYRNGGQYGLDIVSLDIQRGRDHGLPGYTRFRKQCGLPQAATFPQLTDNIPQHIVEKLESVYSHPEDIDLVIGGMGERPAPGSFVGPTFRCILADQFSRSARGDRFFYDLPDQPHSFNKEQLVAIKKTSLARIFCDNGDDIKLMQPNVFKIPSITNELTLCSDQVNIPRLDLAAWKEH